MAVIVLRSVKGSPLTIAEADANIVNLNTEIGTKLNSSAYTAADVLNKIKTVDGAGSGLDADLIDGLNAISSLPITVNKSSVVSRDASGNFTANLITSNLAGNVTGDITSSNVSITGGSISGITALSVADGGTGAVTASDARANLGLVIGTQIQAFNGNLVDKTVVNTFTALQTFRDSLVEITDQTDTTKKLKFECTSINPNSTVTMTIPAVGGVMAKTTDISDATSALQGTIQSSVGYGRLKGFIHFNPTTGVAINAYNLTVSKLANGSYRVFLDASIQSANYTPLVGSADAYAIRSGSADVAVMQVGIGTYTTQYVDIRATLTTSSDVSTYYTRFAQALTIPSSTISLAIFNN